MTTPAPDPLQRFVQAQAGDYAQALAELRAGRKTSHWIWYVLPQLRGLGHSPRSQHYGLAGRDEARAYAAHPLLGPRLVDCVQAMLAQPTRDAAQILGPVDALKFRSCLTLFKAVAGPDSIFAAALQEFYQGQEDELTLKLLKAAR